MKLLLLLNIITIYLLGLGYSNIFIQFLFIIVLIVNISFIFLFPGIFRKLKSSIGIEAMLLFSLFIITAILILNGNTLDFFLSYLIRPLYYFSVFYLSYLYNEKINLKIILIFIFIVDITSLFLYLLIGEPLQISISGYLYSILVMENFFGKSIITGPFISVNEFADLQLFLLVLNFYTYKKSNNKMLFYLVLFISIFLLLITISRTSIFIGIIIGVLYFLYFNKNINPLKKYFLFPSLLVIIGIFLFFYNRGNDLFYFLHKFKQNEAFSGREYLWTAAVETIKESPILGIPISNIRTEYDKYLDSSLQGLGSHNMYLHLLTIVGILGFTVIFILIIYLVSKINLRNLSQEDKFLLIALVILVFIRGFVESGLLFIFSIRILIVWHIFGYLLGKSHRGKGDI